MLRRTALAVLGSLLTILTFGLLTGPAQQIAPAPEAARQSAAEKAPPGRTVFLAGGLSDEQVIVFTATVAAGDPNAVVLLDGPKSGPYIKAFLAAYRPGRVIPVGSFPQGVPELQQRLGTALAPAMEWKSGPPANLWKSMFLQADRIVVCPSEPRGLLLQAACLAGVIRAPLFVTHGEASEAGDLRRLVAGWHPREVLAAGEAIKLCRELPDVHLVHLADQEAVADSYILHQQQNGPIRALVVTNPADRGPGLGGMSTLAPWIALERHGALLLTHDKGDQVEAMVHDVDRLHADVLILVAGLKAIPMERRPNPLHGKDAEIELEPLTPQGAEPFSFATGRLFHEDRGVVALMLARQRLLAEAAFGTTPPRSRKALVASNPGGGLPLLEAFSRNTAMELHNAGYQTTARFEDEVNKDEVRRLVPEQDIFLWEGHYRTLIEDFGLPHWNEPLQPSLVFLQSCLALNEAEAQPLLQRGAVSIVGSTARMYSASGGAFALAFFDAMLYDDRSLGASLRQAKNFLLAYSLLKDKRLSAGAKLGGANLRSAWAFALWGDPTLRLPRPTPPADALEGVRHEVRGNTIVVALPATAYEPVTTDKYQTQMLPNARLAGLVSREAVENRHHLVPFVFLEVALPKAPPGKIPRLRSRVPSAHWVFCWDERRRCGYLLVAPRSRDQQELRFHITWED